MFKKILKYLWFRLLEIGILMGGLGFLMFSYIRIKTVLVLITDPYPLHHANAGLMYFKIGIGLLILFFILIVFRKPHNIEEDAPKHLKGVFKLARLEHEIKELKDKLKREEKIKD